MNIAGLTSVPVPKSTGAAGSEEEDAFNELVSLLCSEKPGTAPLDGLDEHSVAKGEADRVDLEGGCNEEDAPLLSLNDCDVVKTGSSRRSSVMSDPSGLELPSPEDMGMKDKLKRMSWNSIQEFDHGRTALELRIQDLERQEMQQRRSGWCCGRKRRSSTAPDAPASIRSNRDTPKRLWISPRFGIASTLLIVAVFVCGVGFGTTVAPEPSPKTAASGDGSIRSPVKPTPLQQSPSEPSPNIPVGEQDATEAPKHDSKPPSDAAAAVHFDITEQSSAAVPPQSDEQMRESEELDVDVKSALDPEGTTTDHPDHNEATPVSLKLRVPSVLNSPIAAEAP